MSHSRTDENQPPHADRAEASQHDRQAMALEIVKKHAMYAAAVGLVPIPVVNAAGVVAVEIKLLSDLARHYDVPFRRDRVKSIVSALLGGVVATQVGLGAGGLANGAPLVGAALSVAAVPAVAGAVTYAVGKVFILHFESGGTFLDFDPVKVKQYFREQFQKPTGATA